MQRYIAGIDIGSSNICATLASFNFNEFNVIHSVSVKSQGVEKGKIIDINLLAQSIMQCCERLTSATNITIHDYYVGISALDCKCVDTSGSAYLIDESIITNDHIKESIDNMKKININSDEYVFDVYLDSFLIDQKIKCENPINKQAHNLEAIGKALICKNDIIHTYKNVFALCKINVLGIFSNANSLRKIVLNDKTSEENILILDVGGQCTDIVFYKKNILKYLSYVPVGGNNITKDISVCSEIPLDNAERIKVNVSSNYKTKFKHDLIEGFKTNRELGNELFYKIVNARIDEMVKLYCTDIYNAGYFSSINQVYLMGEGLSNFEEIKHVVEDIFNKKTFIVTKKQLGIQISSIINSIAIVKDAYDRLKLDMYNSEIENENESCEKQEDAFQLENKIEEKSNNKKSWLKRLIDDIF